MVVVCLTGVRKFFQVAGLSSAGGLLDTVSPSSTWAAAELLDPHSTVRQLSDQISLAKAFAVIAKDAGELSLAWELSEAIRAAQAVLANVAVR